MGTAWQNRRAQPTADAHDQSSVLGGLDSWKLSRLESLAYELADTGRFHDFSDIHFALQYEQGWSQARTLLDESSMRRRLNRRCASAQAISTEPNVHQSWSSDSAFDAADSSLTSSALDTVPDSNAEPVNAPHAASVLVYIVEGTLRWLRRWTPRSAFLRSAA